MKINLAAGGIGVAVCHHQSKPHQHEMKCETCGESYLNLKKSMKERNSRENKSKKNRRKYQWQ